MANVKNITELPLAESAEGLNLIVNDGGSAKQIAASAVGAQADFNVTDENSPAYIKNKPSVAQANWAETDESKASFIKNKPFYDTRKFDTIEVTFDGNIENKENVNPEEGFYFVKVSDKTPTKEEIIGSTISMNSSGEISTLELSENELEVMGDLLMGADFSFLIAYTDCSLMGLSFTKGLWFRRMMGPDSYVYVSSLSWYGTVSGELKQINSKCIKDMYYTEKIVNAEVLAEITKIPEVSEDGGKATIRIEEPMLALAVNNFYTVIWNGVEYKCLCFVNEENGMLSLSSEEASGIFMILQQPRMNDDNYNAIIEVYDGSESVTISIIGNTEKIHQIDKKYISNGCDVVSAGENSHAEGYKTMASGSESHAEGSYTMASGHNSHAEGCYTTASGWYSHAEGAHTIASGEWSHTEGAHTIASNWHSHAEGNHTIASGNGSHAEGENTTASGNWSHAEGDQTTASGGSSHAEGYKTEASGHYSHAEGNGTKALGLHSHAEGLSTEASEQAAHAEGTNTKASGMFSHAEGSITVASAQFSHAEGSNTTASGMASHAEGSGTTASDIFSHAEGNSTTASGQFSHAEGNSTTASGVFSHAEGYNTAASGTGAHTEGQETTAKGSHSHAEGLGTKASSSQQHAQGRFNIEDTGDIYAHIVGNGTTNDARSNAHTLDWSGNAWYAGTVECTGIILTSPNGTKYQISVADDGTLSANAMPL